MAAPTQVDQAELEGILIALQQSDDATRNAAEERLKGIREQPSLATPVMIRCLRHSAHVPVRELAAVLFRRMLAHVLDAQEGVAAPSTIQRMFLAQLDPGMVSVVKSELLAHLQEEVEHSVRRKVVHVISELMSLQSMIDRDRQQTPELNWPDLLQFMFTTCQQAMTTTGNVQATNMFEVALQLFASAPAVLLKQVEAHLESVYQIFAGALANTQPLSVRNVGAKATMGFISTLTHNRAHFFNLMPAIFSVILDCVSSGDEDLARDALEELIELVDKHARLFRNLVPNMLDTMLQLMGNSTDVEESVRKSACEVLVALAEKASPMLRKQPEFAVRSVPAFVNLMCELEDEPEWYNIDSSEKDEESVSLQGEQAIDRVACAIGGKQVYPICEAFLGSLFTSEQWQLRHAALFCVSAIAEGAAVQMEAVLPAIMHTVLPLLNDPHPRVRYAACNAVGQLAYDFAPGFQETFHAESIGGLLLAMRDADCIRVRIHAGAAMVNFCENASKDRLEPYIDDILRALHEMLIDGGRLNRRLLMQQALTTIATVADSAQEKFINYYDVFMPDLRSILEQSVSDPAASLLRDKAMECISLIGVAVGHEKFAADARHVMDLIASHGGVRGQTDDAEMTFIFGAITRICKVLKAEFVPYLSTVMPPLLQLAQTTPDMAFLDLDERDQQDQYPEEDGWEFVRVDDQRVGIRTTMIDEKCMACEMLVCYARDLGIHFGNHVADVAEIMVPLLKFFFHDEVRTAAADALPFLIDSAMQNHRAGGADADGWLALAKNVWNHSCTGLLEVMSIEPDSAVLQKFVQSFKTCVKVCGDNCLPEEAQEPLVAAIKSQLEKVFERNAERLHNRQDEDYDEELEEELIEFDIQDDKLLRELTDTLHELFRTHGEGLMNVFLALMPTVTAMLEPDRPVTDHQWGLCMFDDFVEYTGPASAQYADCFFPAMSSYLTDENDEVRQAAAFGIGCCALFGGPAYAEPCSRTLDTLRAIIQAPNARSPESLMATENAISAVAKICKCSVAPDALPSLLPALLSWLPVVSDRGEMQFVLGYLCELLESGQIGYFGDINQALPRIVEVFAITMSVVQVDHELNSRIVRAIAQINQTVPEELKNSCWQSLSADQRNALMSAMQQAGLA